MVAVRSRIKQAERSAHSSGRSGGDSRVLDNPGRGVLQKIPTATVSTCATPSCERIVPTMDGRAHFVTSKKSSEASQRLHEFVRQARQKAPAKLIHGAIPRPHPGAAG